MAASIAMRPNRCFDLARVSHCLLKRYSNTSLIRQRERIFRHCTPKKQILLSALPFATVVATDSVCKDKEPFEPNDVRLRSSECLKNAASLVVDSTSAVLSQTVYAIINIEKQYAELLDVLVLLINYQMEVLGQKAEEDRIADIVLETRHEINEVKKRKQDLALLFSSVEKLADATAEVAFATGSSYASTCAGERIYSAQQEVKRVLAVSEKAEKEVAYVEAQYISQITQHEERNKKLEEIPDKTGSESFDIEDNEDGTKNGDKNDIDT